MSNIRKDIENNKNLEINLPIFANNLISTYNRSAFIRLTMNYFTYYEVISENSSEHADEVKNLLKELNQVIEQAVLQKAMGEELESAIAAIDSIRNRIIHTMKVLTTYTDSFRIYEYVLNRIEYQFVEQKLPIDYTDEAFTARIMQYILSDRENIVVNQKICDIVAQLPVRMAKGKYFSLVKDGLSIYKGAEKKTLQDFLYMIRTSSMLDIPEKFDQGFVELKSILSDLENAEYNSLTKEQYQSLSSKIVYGGDYLENIVNLYVMLQELVNDVYSILLSKPYAIKDAKEAEICETIIGAVNGNFNDEKLDEIDQDITDMLILLEGRQEKLFDHIMAEEYLLDDIKNNHGSLLQSLMLEKIYSSLYRISILNSGSQFVDFEEHFNEEGTVDERYLADQTEELIRDLTELFGKSNKMITRAIMATTLSMLPVFFENLDQISEYIQNALGMCRDDAEKTACYHIIDEFICQE